VLERYHKAEKACVDADNWFDTGDVASIDRFGVMKIQDRCAQGSACLMLALFCSCTL
jgi:long-subunit acyl-CoA synthetase (AMP-forming)